MVFIRLAWHNLSGFFGGSLIGTVLTALLSIIGGLIVWGLVMNLRHAMASGSKWLFNSGEAFALRMSVERFIRRMFK